jgi:predicted Ser/Thr protein kinase
MPCFAENTVLSLIQGELSEQARAEAERHLDVCASCRRVVAGAAEEVGAGEPHSPDGPQATATIGRYQVMKFLGQGGMGVVYRAFDPALRRDLAIKLIRARDVPGGVLLQEAQSMARLSHPNVVAVYDTGSFEDQTFLAMEYVDGKTLRRWLADERPSWRDVLSVVVGAGEGLAAAHQAGLVHRDVKPENILVGRDGQAKVTDFGIARFARAGDGPPLEADSALPATHTTVTLFTDHGACVGTPSYMAPEQFASKDLGPWTDQFSFCVVLYEALLGHRPFAAPTVGALKAAVTAGQMREPTSSSVPAGLVEVLRRGLQRNPKERYPSLSALLRALEAAAQVKDAPRRRRAWPSAVGLTLAGLCAAGAWATLGTPDRLYLAGHAGEALRAAAPLAALERAATGEAAVPESQVATATSAPARVASPQRGLHKSSRSRAGSFAASGTDGVGAGRDALMAPAFVGSRGATKR